jgi:hypothetical protein
VPPIVVAGVNKPEIIIPFVIVMLVVQQILFNMILPRILGRIVGLHPLLVFAALLIGGVIAAMGNFVWYPVGRTRTHLSQIIFIYGTNSP